MPRRSKRPCKLPSSPSSSVNSPAAQSQERMQERQQQIHYNTDNDPQITDMDSTTPGASQTVNQHIDLDRKELPMTNTSIVRGIKTPPQTLQSMLPAALKENKTRSKVISLFRWGSLGLGILIPAKFRNSVQFGALKVLGLSRLLVKMHTKVYYTQHHEKTIVT
ncbi:hypothetical protein PCASD_22898 [Puccinia coronata f. sp. avenae]|uniref:Uncharacterized protein n=1 Tax=Puccinia coronata f. sp. avenae TaxID=200324 RepID=A0A2N5U303_9BASI|nr:hypothetical protein PCASD_22898 [Puccinia coronata f. sp. avenae]